MLVNRVLVLISCALLLTGCQHPRLNSSAKTISANTDPASIYAQADGRVEKLLVVPGQVVKAGDPLVQLTPGSSQTPNLSPVAVSMDKDFARPGSAIRSGKVFAGEPDKVSSAYLMALDVISHNLANANTTGFKQLRVNVQELLAQTEQELNNELMTSARLLAGRQTVPDARATSVTRNFSMGALVKTGEQLDLAIQGEGFFELILPDGTRAYTRDGAFLTASDGRITTADGIPLNSGFQAVPPGTTSVSISRDGSMTCLNAKGAVTFQLQICKFANPTLLQALGRNLYQETPASGMVEYGSPGQKGFGELRQGYLELSNVDVVHQVQELIRLQSAYDAYIMANDIRRTFKGGTQPNEPNDRQR
jgi:flagellar basal-body rod protein FlgG